MFNWISTLKEKCNARTMAIFFGLLSTILIVVVVVLAVENSDNVYDLKEAYVKLEILELYIQNMTATTPATEGT
uniref:Nematode cuticle collagen N-terminal domain-containing protein n=1 Tax=Stomoxys calcitrans TaxID=35570 RepID=A0A1I8NR49_STOCA